MDLRHLALRTLLVHLGMSILLVGSLTLSHQSCRSCLIGRLRLWAVTFLQRHRFHHRASSDWLCYPQPQSDFASNPHSFVLSADRCLGRRHSSQWSCCPPGLHFSRDMTRLYAVSARPAGSLVVAQPIQDHGEAPPIMH